MEEDKRIGELYAQYKAPTPTREIPLVSALARQLRNFVGNNSAAKDKEEKRQLSFRIIDILRNQPGTYPLTRISFSGPRFPNGRDGFAYGFDYTIGDTTFPIEYWSNNDQGILVQKEDANSIPEIEIPEDSGVSQLVLHLPEGFRIPVGPLNFKGDGLPMSEEEIQAEKDNAIAMAEAMGIKVNQDTLDRADSMSTGSGRKSTPRYFYWQPELPDTKTHIGIEFESLMPQEMTLVLEGAPVFRNTAIIPDEDFEDTDDDEK